MKSDLLLPTSVGHMVRTVLGEIPYQNMGITDAHNHVWIEPIPEVEPAAPVLNQYNPICEELKLFHAAGGRSLLDCQPGGCGRNGNRLYELSRESGVHIIACTGFHRRKYYPSDHWLFSASAEQATRYFLQELNSSLGETSNQLEYLGTNPVRAGFLKIALEMTWGETSRSTLEGAANAAHETGSLIEIHTEKGLLAEDSVTYFETQGVAARQLVLCHMDKRPDPVLHADLARSGVLLEYDTFYRPKYEPESNLWPLIHSMAVEGLSDHVALATDMAEGKMYSTIGNGPGLASLPSEIRSKLVEMKIPESSVQQMLGGNIARRLAGLD